MEDAAVLLVAYVTYGSVLTRLLRIDPKAVTPAVELRDDVDYAPIERSPLLGLTSGYVTRSADRFPQQGSRAPWKVNQNYVYDYRQMRRSDVVDPEMVFSNPRPAGAGTRSKVGVRS